jgi:hypothetical protein
MSGHTMPDRTVQDARTEARPERGAYLMQTVMRWRKLADRIEAEIPMSSDPWQRLRNLIPEAQAGTFRQCADGLERDLKIAGLLSNGLAQRPIAELGDVQRMNQTPFPRPPGDGGG